MATDKVIKKRREDICNLLKERDVLTIHELSSILNTPKMTIRRDLDYLSKQEKIKRIHGGVVSNIKDYEPYYLIRSLEMIEEKKAIGRVAASLIPENSLIFMDVGTTLIPLAKNIPTNKNITVLTNWIPVAIELAKKGFTNIFLFCGKVIGREMSVVGNYSLEFLDNFNIETAFLGVGGISIENGITDFSYEEIEIKKQVIQRAKKKIVLAANPKFGRISPIKICDLSDITSIVTDNGLKDEVRQKYLDFGVEIIIANKINK